MRGLLFGGEGSLLGAVMVVVFFALFLGLLFGVYRASSRKEMERGALLPFED